jgi:hypothetical protein
MFRILIWLIELGVLVTLGALIIVSLVVPGKAFSAILRGAANLVIGAVCSVMIGLGVGLGGIVFGAGDPVANGLLAMILTLPLSVIVLDRLGRRRSRRLGAFAHRGGSLLAGRSALSPGAAPEPAADMVVVTAWNRAARLAPAQRQRLNAAREACAYVLHWSEGHPFDIETMECAVLIRKRLPELVDQTASYCELSGRSERREVTEAMVGDLERLGRMALTRVERSKEQLGESLAATRAHIASRTNETPAF